MEVKVVEAQKVQKPGIFDDIDIGLPGNQLSKLFLETILEKSVDISDPLYKHAFKETYKVNLDICGHIGCQLYEPDKFTYKNGEFLDDPDLILTFTDIEFIREKLRGDNILIAGGRDTQMTSQMFKAETLFTAYTKAKVGNAQLFLVRIPFFKDIIEDLGASSGTLPGRVEPDTPITPVKEGEIATLIQKMLKEVGEMPENLYQKNFQGQPMKINWDIDGILAYQHFDETGYKSEFGKNIEEADVLLKFPNPIHAKRFLSKIPANYTAKIVDKKLSFFYKKPVLILNFKDKGASSVNLGRLPFFRALNKLSANAEEAMKEERKDLGHYIPMDLPLGNFEDVPVPYKVFEHFIMKSSNIVLRTCPCREAWQCKNHSIELGCIFMGDDTKNMALPPEQGYVATKEQALEHIRKGMAEGLIPLLGRIVGEAEGGHGVEDTGKFLSGCLCCDCCCIGVKSRQLSHSRDSMGGDNDGRLAGMTVVVDQEKCIGCGKCVEVCPYNWRYLEEGKSTVDQDLCIGCGRCVSVCPTKAISIDVQDPDLIEKFITEIEALVDVTDQTTKI